MLLTLSLLSAGAFTGQVMAAEDAKKAQVISRAGSQPSVKGAVEYFTGNVRVDPLFPTNDATHVSGALCHLRAGGQVRMAYTPHGAAPDRCLRRWPDSGMGRPDRGNQSGRCDLVSPKDKALARSFAHQRHDPYCHYGDTGRQECPMDGKSHR